MCQTPPKLPIAFVDSARGLGVTFADERFIDRLVDANADAGGTSQLWIVGKPPEWAIELFLSARDVMEFIHYVPKT